MSPAGYAFAIWGPIFFLCLAYALYQALPSNREQPLLRRVGWASAGAFFGNGLWEIVVPLRQFVLAQALMVGVFICAGVAYLRLMRSERGVVGTADRWLVVPPLGLLFGWITAANPVSLASEAVRLGLVGSGAPPRRCWAWLSCSSAVFWPRRCSGPGGEGLCRATWLTLWPFSRLSSG